MSSSRAASKTINTLDARMEELKQTVEAIDAKPMYIPAIATKNDITDSIPEMAVVIIGNDDRVSAAMANHLRTYIEQYLGVSTVPLGNLQESENYIDYQECREEHAHTSKEYQDEIILDTVESVWDGMVNSYPAIRRDQMRVGIEIMRGNVDITKQVRHTAQVSIGETKIVDQVLTTIYP